MNTSTAPATAPAVDTEEFIRANDACIKLREFILAHEGEFATSWSSYSIQTTPEEDLIYACFATMTPINAAFNVDADWFREVPSMLYMVGQAFLCQCDSEDARAAWIEKVSEFAASYMKDAMGCFLREIA